MQAHFKNDKNPMLNDGKKIKIRKKSMSTCVNPLSL
jgi:hypothetical protein